MSDLCPCCSQKCFTDCCLPIISGDKQAETPEQLMRSRYSAYAIKDGNYVFQTYANISQKFQSPDEIQAWANECVWVNLIILDTSEYIKNKKNNSELKPILFKKNVISDKVTVEGEVIFSAFYLSPHTSTKAQNIKAKKTLNKITERSRFICEPIKGESVWRYLDGDIIEDEQIATISSNDLCPCFKNQQLKKPRKYKRCCGH